MLHFYDHLFPRKIRTSRYPRRSIFFPATRWTRVNSRPDETWKREDSETESVFVAHFFPPGLSTIHASGKHNPTSWLWHSMVHRQGSNIFRCRGCKNILGLFRRCRPDVYITWTATNLFVSDMYVRVRHFLLFFSPRISRRCRGVQAGVDLALQRRLPPVFSRSLPGIFRSNLRKNIFEIFSRVQVDKNIVDNSSRYQNVPF